MKRENSQSVSRNTGSHQTPYDATHLRGRTDGEITARPSRSRTSITRDLRRILAPLAECEHDHVARLQHQAYARLADLLTQHANAEVAASFLMREHQHQPLDTSIELHQRVSSLPRSQRAWATFLLEEANSVRDAVTMRLRQIQSDDLREFAARVIQLETSDLRAFAARALAQAGRLTEHMPAWGQLMLLRPYHDADSTVSNRVEKLFTMTFSAGSPALAAEAPLTGRFDLDHPPLVAGPAAEVAHSRSPLLLNDIVHESDDWPNLTTRAVVCVPLLSDPVSQSAIAATDLLGVLLVAASRPFQYAPDDCDTLARLGKLVAAGLNRISELHERQGWIYQVMHDQSKTMRSLMGQVRDIDQPLHAALAAQDLEQAQHAMGEVRALAENVRDLVFLTNDLMYWAADLTDDIVDLRDEAVSPLDTATFAADLRVSTGTFAKIQSGTQIIWTLPQPALFVASSPKRAHLVTAVLFKYIENAVKYGSRTDVQVIIAGAGNEVEFAVRNTGRQIPLDEAAQLFALGFRGSFRASAIPGSGFGLAQVKRIARLLDGAVGYRPVGDDQNEFWLRLPAAAAP